MNVLEAITPSKIGGAEVFVADLCEELPRLGARVELFCPTGRPFVDYAARRGISPITWKTHGKLDPVTVIRLARLARTRRIDVIHTHLSTASLLGAFAGRLARIPSVAHVHGLNTATCFRYSTAIITVSEAVKRHLLAQGIDEKRIHVIHNGVDLDRFAPADAREAKSKIGFDPDKPLIGVFGRLSSEKGQQLAIEAMFILRQDHPSARLLIVGDGADRTYLRASAEALGIASSVTFAGFVVDVHEMMSACDVILTPSLKEGFGLAAAEAMALAKPVVAAAVGGLCEIVADGETGLLVPPNDPNAIAQALAKLIENDDLRPRFGTQGRARAEERFDRRKQMALVLSALREVLLNRGEREIGG